MTGNFGGVLSCVRMRGTEKGNQYLVDYFPFRIFNVPESEGIRRTRGQWLGGFSHRGEDAVGDGDSFGTRHADKPDGASLGGGYGADGVLRLFLLHKFELIISLLMFRVGDKR